MDMSILMAASAKNISTKGHNQKKYADSAVSGVSEAKAMTPMMAQYCNIKEQHPESLLFYRMGDFYELFFDDAVIASKALGIQLTKRGKHQGADIPMCGVPVHSADDYLQRLIRGGFRVAVCEQMEDPAEAKKRGSKSVVKRDVVRVVTPGTLTESSLLDSSQNNFLMAIYFDSRSKTFDYSLSFVDISTGEFIVTQSAANDLLGEVARVSPKEILISDKYLQNELFLNLFESFNVCPIPHAYFNSLSGERDLKKTLGVEVLDGIGAFSKPELCGIGALLKYIEITQIDKMPLLHTPKQQLTTANMLIDAATRTNLELTKSIRGENEGSLLHALDRTVTGPGGRVLGHWISSPLTDPVDINKRLDVVSFFLNADIFRKNVRDILRGAPDIARSYSRLALERGGPRDLGAIRDGLELGKKLKALFLSDKVSVDLPKILQGFISTLKNSSCELSDFLLQALEDDLPFQKRDGGFVRPGFSAELDEARSLRDTSRKIIAELQLKYSEITKVKSLKVKYNNFLGYFIEVPASQGDNFMKSPLNETFIHRQTLANSMRFTTTELNEMQTKILSAAERSLSIELDLFDGCLNLARKHEELLLSLPNVLAQLDVFSSLAELASEQKYCRPIVDNSEVFCVLKGRHPVVDIALQSSQSGQFIENDCILNSPISEESDNETLHSNERLWMLTGPNMAGKSTFLRQNALIGILAHIGSYVPAVSAHIGVIDRLFSRVGASDDLARGRSTFMVEMVETAAILNQSSKNSFVILDEIGRGTSTYDGLSIAWATLEYLYNQIQCRAIFATHYHELTALTCTLDKAANVTMQVKEWEEDIVFLHKVISGAADRSYGVQVAKLAGLPKEVVNRASEVLAKLEETQNNSVDNHFIEDLPLFAAFSEETVPNALSKENDDILKNIADIDPDELSPKAALDFVYQLKRLSSSSH